jgi:predicted protein tyrosine phosphatase
MKPNSLVTICGLDELCHHSASGVTHVLSILDPGWPEPEDFWSYDRHHRTTLHFNDIILPAPDQVLPRREHVEAILGFGDALAAGPAGGEGDGHVLVHCHMGISRSTAAVAMLLAKAHAQAEEDFIFTRLLEVREKAWPNSLMIGYADEVLGREGRLTAALGRLYARQLERRPEIEEFMRTHGRAGEIEMARAARAG